MSTPRRPTPHIYIDDRSEGAGTTLNSEVAESVDYFHWAGASSKVLASSGSRLSNLSKPSETREIELGNPWSC